MPPRMLVQCPKRNISYINFKSDMFEAINPYYDLSIMAKLIKRDVENAFIKLEESRNRTTENRSWTVS